MKIKSCCLKIANIVVVHLRRLALALLMVLSLAFLACTSPTSGGE